MWSAVRWHAYRIMGAMPYVDMQKNGISSPMDLIRFPWDDDKVSEADIPTDDEVNEMQEILRNMNEKGE